MCYPMRFEPGADLQKGLLKFTEDNGLSAAFVITCVGSVTKATLRMANSTTVSATCMKQLTCIDILKHWVEQFFTKIIPNL